MESNPIRIVEQRIDIDLTNAVRARIRANSGGVQAAVDKTNTVQENWTTLDWFGECDDIVAAFESEVST